MSAALAKLQNRIARSGSMVCVGLDTALGRLPEQLELIDEIPRNPAGKILKKDLRERYGAA